jgi:transcriptional regulator with XRE-family HTH domain
MNSVEEDLSTALADVVRRTRAARGLTVNALGAAARVSPAMISKVERGQAQPTAVLLGKLSGALGLTLSELVAKAEGDHRRVSRRTDQPTWTDPDTGYRRRAVSPRSDLPIQLVDVELPPGAEVEFAADTYAFMHHQIWVLEGHLRFREGDATHELDAGDCLTLGPSQLCAYVNPTERPCRYLVALAREHA